MVHAITFIKSVVYYKVIKQTYSAKVLNHLAPYKMNTYNNKENKKYND